MDAWEIIILSVTIGCIIGAIFFVSYAVINIQADMTQNTKEHEELKALDCGDDIIGWANTHPRWIDHRQFALLLFNACQTNGDKPIFRGHD